MDLSSEDHEDDTNKEKRNPEPLPKKKEKRVALRGQFLWLKEVDGLYYCQDSSANSNACPIPARYCDIRKVESV